MLFYMVLKGSPPPFDALDRTLVYIASSPVPIGDARASHGGGKSRAWYTLSAHAPNISINLIINLGT